MITCFSIRDQSLLMWRVDVFLHAFWRSNTRKIPYMSGYHFWVTRGFFHTSKDVKISCLMCIDSHSQCGFFRNFHQFWGWFYAPKKAPLVVTTFNFQCSVAQPEFSVPPCHKITFIYTGLFNFRPNSIKKVNLWNVTNSIFCILN